MYDVAIIGAGPAGLMAAKTAAAIGLKAVLLEKKKAVAPVTRACCEQLIMDRDFQGDTVRLDNGRIVSLRNDFSVAYAGRTIDVTDKFFISPAGHKIHFAYPDRRPIVIKIDKGHLLQNLWQDCADHKVELAAGCHVHAAKDLGDAVSLQASTGGAAREVRARKLIIADGVNSRTAERMGLNAGRRCLASALCVIYFLRGVTGFNPHNLSTYFGRAYGGLAPLTLNTALDDDQTACLVVIGNKNSPPEKMFRNISTAGALAPALHSARIVRKAGCAARAYTSMKTPYCGNVLVAGDAAAYVEVEMQGALACGWRAARAAADELAGNAGFKQYARWWQESFEFNGDDWLQVAQGFALVPTYTDEELDYLFGLIEGETLEGTYNQYKSPRLMWGAISKHRDRIADERPQLHQKILTSKASLSDML